MAKKDIADFPVISSYTASSKLVGVDGSRKGFQITIPSATSWQNVAPTSDIVIVEPIQIRINEYGMVHVKGRFRYVDYGMGWLSILANEFRPKSMRVIPVFVHKSVPLLGFISINTDGKARYWSQFAEDINAYDYEIEINTEYSL